MIYISDHPLEEYHEIFSQLNITYREFLANDKTESLVAGTIMSIQEKKSAKRHIFAIVKFSDDKVSLNFFYSETLINNRLLLKETESFILTLHKDSYQQMVLK